MTEHSSASDPYIRVMRLHSALQRIIHACSRFEDPERLVADLSSVIADATGAGRLLVFLRDGGGDSYSLAYGIRPPSDVSDKEEGEDLPNWLEFNPRIVCRSALSSIPGTEHRAMLEDVLNEHASELLVPLFGRGLLGWLFIGPSILGKQYSELDLTEIYVLACYFAVTLENVLQGDSAQEQG